VEAQFPASTGLWSWAGSLVRFADHLVFYPAGSDRIPGIEVGMPQWGFGSTEMSKRSW